MHLSLYFRMQSANERRKSLIDDMLRMFYQQIVTLTFRCDQRKTIWNQILSY